MSRADHGPSVAPRGRESSASRHGGLSAANLRSTRGIADFGALANLIPQQGYVHGDRPTAIDAGIYGFVANIYFYDIDAPLKQFVLSHDGLVQHCRAIHAAVTTRVAERVGFEPTVQFPAHTLSKRAP